MKLSGATFLLLASPALLLLALSGCSKSREAATTTLPALVISGIAEARLESLPVTQNVAGTVRPADRAVVSARVMGTIATADFTIGQTVAAGDVLITLDAAELQARLDQAQAALAQITADYARQTSLLAKGASTQAEVDTLADQRRAAEAALGETRTLLGYTRVAAPFAGTIARKYVNPGDLATAGTPLFELEGRANLRAEVSVPASLPMQAIGARLPVLVGEHTVEGTLVEIAEAVDSASRTRLAKVALPAGAKASPGDYARVPWPAGETPAITVPADAVTTLGQMERVFVVDRGVARLRLVKTAGASGDRIRIAAGLDAGESVVRMPPASLRDGQPVETAR